MLTVAVVVVGGADSGCGKCDLSDGGVGADSGCGNCG